MPRFVRYLIAPVLALIIMTLGCRFGMEGFATTLLVIVVIIALWFLSKKLPAWWNNFVLSLPERKARLATWWNDHGKQVGVFLSLISTLIIIGYFLFGCILPRISWKDLECGRCGVHTTSVSPVVPTQEYHAPVPSSFASSDTVRMVATSTHPAHVVIHSDITNWVVTPVGYVSYVVTFPTAHGDSSIVRPVNSQNVKLPASLKWVDYRPLDTDSVTFIVIQRDP